MPSHRPFSRKSPKTASGSSDDKNTANTQQVRFFKLYFDFNVFSAENRRLFSIEFQLHRNSHITVWLPVPPPRPTPYANHNKALLKAVKKISLEAMSDAAKEIHHLKPQSVDGLKPSVECLLMEHGKKGDSPL